MSDTGRAVGGRTQPAAGALHAIGGRSRPDEQSRAITRRAAGIPTILSRVAAGSDRGATARAVPDDSSVSRRGLRVLSPRAGHGSRDEPGTPPAVRARRQGVLVPPRVQARGRVVTPLGCGTGGLARQLQPERRSAVRLPRRRRIRRSTSSVGPAASNCPTRHGRWTAMPPSGPTATSAARATEATRPREEQPSPARRGRKGLVPSRGGDQDDPHA